MAIKSECTRCECSMRDEDRGHWRKEMCAGCEGASVTAAAAKLNSSASVVNRPLGTHEGCGGPVFFATTAHAGWKFCARCDSRSLRGQSVDLVADTTPADADGPMSHADWLDTVERGYGIATMFRRESLGQRVLRYALRTRPVSVVARTVGYGVWRMTGGT